MFRRGRRLRTTGPRRRVENLRVRVQRVFSGRRQERDGENKKRRTAGEVRVCSRGRVVHDTNRSKNAIVAVHGCSLITKWRQFFRPRTTYNRRSSRAPRKTPNSITHLIP